MWPERWTVAIWLAFGIGVGLGVMYWFDTYTGYDCPDVGYPAGPGNASPGANEYVCDVPRHLTALHLAEGGGIGLGVAVIAMLIWVGFTYCIPAQPPVIRPVKRERLRSAVTPRR